MSDAYVAVRGGVVPGREADGGSCSLETIGKTVTDHADSPRWSLTRCGCDSWFCSHCAPTKGWKLRQRLVPVVQTFGGVVMLTLTVDPAHFADGRAAWEYVRENRCIAKMMQGLDRAGHLLSRRYFYVVEWHKSGFPHWHVLVDARWLPHASVAAEWNKNVPTGPGRGSMGFVWLTGPRGSRQEFTGKAHAANYATKYLTKNPELGYPEWVMDLGFDRRVKRYGVSHGFWGDTEPKKPAARSRVLVRQTYRMRVRHCGERCTVFARVEDVDRSTGEVKTRVRWVGILSVHADELLEVDDNRDQRRRRRDFHHRRLADVVQNITDQTGVVPRWIRISRAALTEST